MLITSLIESIWVSNLIGGISKAGRSLLVNFIFLMPRDNKASAAKDHGKNFRSKPAPSFSGIIHWLH